MTIPAVVAPANAPAVVAAVVEPTAIPAVAPAAPVHLDAPAPAPIPAPVVAAPVAIETSPVTYDPTGDAGLDVALGFVGKLGIGMDHPAMQATATGDFSLIKAHLATMGDKATGWEQMVALAEQAHTRTEDAKTATAAKVASAVHAVAGGAENWATVKTWASANADASEKAQINAMFDAGPVQARAAAMMLVDAYSKAGGTVVTPASATANPSGGTASTSNAPLNAKDYATAVRVLAAKVGSSNLSTSPEYAQLGQRRHAFRG